MLIANDRKCTLHSASGHIAVVERFNFNTGDGVCGQSVAKGGDGRRQMEDVSFGHTSADGKVRVGAVFDGHGPRNGHVVAGIARDTLATMLQANSAMYTSWTIPDWSEWLLHVFDSMQVAVSAHRGSRTDWPGGSTATIIVELVGHGPSSDRVLLCANAGDTFGGFVTLRPRPNGAEGAEIVCGPPPKLQFLTTVHLRAVCAERAYGHSLGICVHHPGPWP
jgi:hypothetical protein